jgi:hypothetical protein
VRFIQLSTSSGQIAIPNASVFKVEQRGSGCKIFFRQNDVERDIMVKETFTTVMNMIENKVEHP